MLNVEVTFKAGDAGGEKLQRARECARELSAIECSWHSMKARVAVTAGDDGQLQWSVNDACCEGFKAELLKAIRQVEPKL